MDNNKTDDKSMSIAKIRQIVWRVRDDEADPEEVRELLEYSCNLVDRREPVPPEIHRYIWDSLRAYLDGSKKSLDSSFGVKGRPGRPKADEDVRIAMAKEILRLRLEGARGLDAMTEAAEKFHKESSVVGEAWAAHKLDAIQALRVERGFGKDPWTEREKRILSKILSKMERTIRELLGKNSGKKSRINR